MFLDHFRRGAIAGLIGGIAYGLFVLLVGSNLVALAEHFEGGSHHGGGGVLSASTSVLAGVLWGLLLGIVAFGVVYYFLEPAIPGPPELRSYLLAMAGFVTISGAPWIMLPPQPPGVEQALPTETRLVWYAAMTVVGALACGLAGAGYRYVRADDSRGVVLAVLALSVLAVSALLAPANLTTGPAPSELITAFRWVAVFGQLGLWAVIASVHTALRRRDARPTTTDYSDLGW